MTAAPRRKRLWSIYDCNPSPKRGRIIRGVVLKAMLNAHDRFLSTDFRVRNGPWPVEAKGHRADFGLANVRGADFRGRDLRMARFDEADLRFADFTGANLTDAEMIGADLRGAKGLTVEMIDSTRSMRIVLPKVIYDELAARDGEEATASFYGPRPIEPASPQNRQAARRKKLAGISPA